MNRPDHQPSPSDPAHRESSRRNRTGIFGGSFNPIHTGHISLARQLLEQAQLDEIWFVVSPLNPLKKTTSDLLDDDLRLDMVRHALAGEPHLMVSDYEFHLPRPSYMWNTLQHLSVDYPDREFVLIIGADNWQSFDRWARPDYIRSHYEIVIYPRTGFPIDEASLPQGIRLVNTQLYPISSTLIRQKVKAHEPIDALVPLAIHDLVLRYYR
ncbi:MAG: nicotinate-nucleotide adenylyltransferase [Prevotella sp.]|nr:nicotinate-nucleotide adenylyltransferase [Prevotella sp.]